MRCRSCDWKGEPALVAVCPQCSSTFLRSEHSEPANVGDPQARLEARLRRNRAFCFLFHVLVILACAYVTLKLQK